MPRDIAVARRLKWTEASSSLDAHVGDAIEAAIMRKHRRRLSRRGWARALSPGPGIWAESTPPPREGCRLEVLVDGTEAFAAMAEAIRGARRTVWVAGWFISPGFELIRGDDGSSVVSLLAEAAERVDVRVLVWAGSPAPAFTPNRRQVAATIAELTSGTRIRCEADPHEHPLHCHHEKTLVVDGEVAFVGGIDTTDLKNDRSDTTAHPARGRTGWHDVATRLTGPVVADVAGHFALRWRELTGERLESAAVPQAAGSHTVQMVRTIQESMYDDLPHGDFSILESYVRAIGSAQRFIYLENQFLWAPEITTLLVDKLRHPPHPDFRILLVLPSRAHAGQDDTLGQLGVLQDADEGDRLTVTTLRSVTDGRSDQLYVHAKVGIIDDRWLTVGSANLNAHSLFNDSEVNVVCDARELACQTRLRLWAEHLEVPPEQLEGRDPTAVIDELWRPIAFEQLRRLHASEPPSHRLLAMSGVSRRSRRLLGPLNGLLADA